MKASFLRAARNELKAAIEHYEQEREGLGEEFTREAENALERIVAFPLAWSALGRDVRRCRLNRFPYGLVYVIRDEEIKIVAVMHLHRKPGYWESRLDD